MSVQPFKRIWSSCVNVNKDAFDKHLFDHLCRHLVCLTVRYRHLDPNGRAFGKEHFAAYSAFLLVVDDVWFLVTAGHILEKLRESLVDGKIGIESCCIADFFGKDAKVFYPTPFPFDHASKSFVHDDAFGLDLGLIHLTDLFRDGMLANGVIPISEVHWENQQKVHFEMYHLLGFPEEPVVSFNEPIEYGGLRRAVVAPVVISVEAVDSAEVPDTVLIPESTLPWFIGRLTAAHKLNIVGMSGGPIFGIRQNADGGLQY